MLPCWAFFRDSYFVYFNVLIDSNERDKFCYFDVTHLPKRNDLKKGIYILLKLPTGTVTPSLNKSCPYIVLHTF
jgi:hypothetical protein